MGDLTASAGVRRAAWARRLASLTLLILALGLSPPRAQAGPPFATDDPVPVDQGHWEIYGFSNRLNADDDKYGVLAGIEVNYGAAPNLQLHVIAPIAFNYPTGGPFKAGPGDIELGVKYRFLPSDQTHWWPQIAIFPLLEVPTGKSTAGLGAGQTRAFLPLWLQKDFGPWTTYGGGGYWINPGPGNQNYWFTGWLLQRQITKKLALGGELYYQSSDEPQGRDGSGFDLGLIYDFSEHYHLLLSAGRALHNVEDNRFSYYIGLQHTF